MSWTDRIDRITFWAFSASAAIWIAGLGLALRMNMIVVLPTLAFLVAASAVVALRRGSTGTTVLGIWVCAVLLALAAAYPVTEGLAGAVVVATIAATLVVGAWALVGLLLLHSKTGGPRP